MNQLKLTLLLSIAFLVKLSGQENSHFVDSILLQIANDERVIYNEDLKGISKEKTWREIVRIDTICNDSWTRPQIIDNVFHEKFGGSRVRTEEFFDTVTFVSNPRFIKFVKDEISDSGNFLYVRTIFLIDRTEPLKKKTTQQLKKKHHRILNNKNSFWTNLAIFISNKKIELDSCHSLFQISFYNDFTFSQKYNNRDTSKCYTEEMAHFRNTGIEGDDDFLDYENKLQGHYIHNPIGTWRIENNELHLKAKGGETFLRFELVKVKRKKLHLRLIDSNQEIVLRIKKHNN